MTGFLVAAFAAFLILAYFRASAWVWTAGTEEQKSYLTRTIDTFLSKGS